MKTDERRRFPRYPFRAPVKIEWGSRVMKSQTRLLSQRGMFVESPDPFSIGETFSAVILLHEPVRVNCVVRMVEPGQGMGVEFVEVPPEVQEELGKQVALLTGQ